MAGRDTCNVAAYQRSTSPRVRAASHRRARDDPSGTVHLPPSPRPWCRQLDGGALSIDAIDRMLLITDGTIGHAAQGGHGRLIATELVRAVGPAPGAAIDVGEGRWWHPPVDLVDAAPFEHLVVRQVVLGGATTGAAFVPAEAVVVTIGCRRP